MLYSNCFLCQTYLFALFSTILGKSQLLQFASAVFPRSVLTTGMGTTGAGLTCAATKDEHGCWSLEAGALVLASGGVCCIDEFASIKEHDRSTIHEAMEQQTLSIAKAGMIVKLNTVTTIIASCNFKGQFDASVDFATNIAIGTPLLSRFDIILLLLDKPKKSWDIAVSTHLLQTSLDKSTELLRKTDADCLEKQWNIEMLREYVHYVRKRVNPIMTNEAKLLLVRTMFL
jgi:DNA helicase MCM9